MKTLSVRNAKIAWCVSCLLLCIGGVTLYALGESIKYNNIDVMNVIPININLIPTVLIVLGGAMFFLSIVGAAGVKRELEAAFRGVVLLMFPVIMVKIWVLVEVYRKSINNIHAMVIDWLQAAFVDPKLNPGEFSVVEHQFHCCGTTGPEVYNKTVPVSCCMNDVRSMMYCESRFQIGCNQPVADYFLNYGNSMVTAVIITMIIDVIVIFFGVLLLRTLAATRPPPNDSVHMIPEGFRAN